MNAKITLLSLILTFTCSIVYCQNSPDIKADVSKIRGGERRFKAHKDLIPNGTIVHVSKSKAPIVCISKVEGDTPTIVHSEACNDVLNESELVTAGCLAISNPERFAKIEQFGRDTNFPIIQNRKYIEISLRPAKSPPDKSKKYFEVFIDVRCNGIERVRSIRPEIWEFEKGEWILIEEGAFAVIRI